MLDTVDAVASRAAALLDDPSQSFFTEQFLAPYIDQEFDELCGEMEALGMEYTEGLVSFDVQPQTSDLSPLQQPGQPLATMKAPKRVWWKQQGFPDTSYREAAMVDELMDVDPASTSVPEWRNANGAIQITPANLAITLRVAFDQLSSTLYDPQQGVTMGTGHILAARVALYVANVRGMAIVPFIEKKANKAWSAFASLVVKRRQQKNVVAPKIHRGTQSSPPAGYL